MWAITKMCHKSWSAGWFGSSDGGLDAAETTDFKPEWVPDDVSIKKKCHISATMWQNLKKNHGYNSHKRVYKLLCLDFKRVLLHLNDRKMNSLLRHKCQ